MTHFDDMLVGLLNGDHRTGAATTSSATAGTTLSKDELLASMRRIERRMAYAAAGFDWPRDPDERAERANKLEQFCDAAMPGGLMPWQRDMLHVLGMPIRESHMATQTVPVRAHKKRRNQTDAYHRRIQKKWNKRFGFKQVPAAYVMDASALLPGGRGQQVLVVHPEIAHRLRRAT